MQQPTQESSPPQFITWERQSHSWFDQVRQVISRQDWLGPVGDAVHKVVDNILAPIRPSGADALHGVWLGHPLHPVMTDIPIGAATTAMIIDAAQLGTDDRRLAACADAAWAISTAAMVPTAAAGITDWSYVYGYPGRAGLIHGTLNVTSMLLNVASLGLRMSGNRRRGVAVSSLGYLSSLAAAWLGGQLVYEERIGIDHSCSPEGPENFVSVMPESELREGQLRKVTANGASVLLFRRGGDIFAIGETCAHLGGPLSEGKAVIEGKGIGDTVVCPWHSSQYRLQDGTVVHGPSTYNQPCYEARVLDGQIQVRRAPR